MENMKIHLQLWLSKTWSISIYSGNYAERHTSDAQQQALIWDFIHSFSLSRKSQWSHSPSWKQRQKKNNRKLSLPQSNLIQTVNTKQSCWSALIRDQPCISVCTEHVFQSTVEGTRCPWELSCAAYGLLQLSLSSVAVAKVTVVMGCPIPCICMRASFFCSHSVTRVLSSAAL